MVILIAGGTHTGKTVLAQKLLERYRCPCLSIDHLKMGLIRSGLCPLTPESGDAELTDHLWPVVREMVKTAIENGQDLIVEGCYIPFDYQADFDGFYLPHIRFLCLVFSSRYIEEHFAEILRHANVIEQRLDDSDCTQGLLLEENRRNLALCQANGCPFLLIDEDHTQALSQYLETL